nr:MAG TPA: hypothetical protein [Caudoviricetes sp.]
MLSSEQWGDVLKNMKGIILFSISGWREESNWNNKNIGETKWTGKL